jgi:protein TonB
VWPDELPETIDIALDPRPLPDNARPEPTLASVPYFVDFDEPARLDPERLGLLWELPPRSANPIRARGPLSSLLIHLLPLLTVLGWPHPAMELPRPIPVQLVIEEPPPPPPEPAPAPPPQSQPKQPGRLASEDFGDTKPKDPGTAATTAPPAAGAKQPASATPPPQTARLVTPPPVPPPKPAPPDLPQLKLSKAAGAPVPPRDETPQEAPRTARYLGPTASRDDYLAYLVTLTRQHIGLLPLSLIGSRRGETIVAVAVRDDGTIARVSVARSSGYPDIDEKVEQMVRAVVRFPPVPQWFQGNVMELELTLHFPEALQR